MRERSLMLTADKLHELAVKKETTELNIRREYVQHVFLSYFYQQPQSADVFFKGGTALHLIYLNPRFSEDLDFSTPRTDIDTIEDGIQNALIEVEREGIATGIAESKPTTGGYLAIIKFHLAQDKVSIQIEISSRDKKAQGRVVTIASDFVSSYIVMMQREEQLVKQKMRALLERRKPRDFYDLYFILRKEKMLPPEGKNMLPQALKELMELRTSFGRDLEQFLPRSHWLQIKNFKSILKQEIQKYI